MTTDRRVKVVFGALIFLSAAMVSLAFIVWPLAGMFFHDSNFEVFDVVLTEQQRNSIFTSVGAIMIIYILLLVISNVFWIVGVWYLVSRFKKRDDHVA